MGGAAYLIHGTLDPMRVDSGPRQKTLLGRLLGCFGVRARKQVADLGTHQVITLPPGRLGQQLKKGFLQFLSEQIPSPWPATKEFLDYLKSLGMTVYLRGEQKQESDEIDWYVQLTFSGCGGMAEVSAELAHHWADIWVRKNIQQINETILQEEGFTGLIDSPSSLNDVTFVPVGKPNYSVYAAGTLVDGEPPGFDVDESYLLSASATPEDDETELLADMQAQLGKMMADGQCRCQLCMPDYQPIHTNSI